MATDPEYRIQLQQDSAFFTPDPESESKICVKPDPDPDSLFLFGSSRNLRGLNVFV